MSDDAPDDRPLIIDELAEWLAKLRLPYEDNAPRTGSSNELGGQGRVGRDIVSRLARTLALPDRFVDAVAMHALEVLACNGSGRTGDAVVKGASGAPVSSARATYAPSYTDRSARCGPLVATPSHESPQSSVAAKAPTMIVGAIVAE